MFLVLGALEGLSNALHEPYISMNALHVIMTISECHACQRTQFTLHQVCLRTQLAWWAVMSEEPIQWNMVSWHGDSQEERTMALMTILILSRFSVLQ